MGKKCFKGADDECWKSNRNNMIELEYTEVTEQFKSWMDLASSIFGGLDLCALDVLYKQDTGEYHILELNDTGINNYL